MPFERSSGLLLHIASLPSFGGIGDLGPAAYAFADFLAASKQRLWQVLPLGPTGYGNSPYAALSAFAGNPLLISLEFLADHNWLEHDRLADRINAIGHAHLDLLLRIGRVSLARGIAGRGEIGNRGAGFEFQRDGVSRSKAGEQEEEGNEAHGLAGDPREASRLLPK